MLFAGYPDNQQWEENMQLNLSSLVSLDQRKLLMQTSSASDGDIITAERHEHGFFGGDMRRKLIFFIKEVGSLLVFQRPLEHVFKTKMSFNCRT